MRYFGTFEVPPIPVIPDTVLSLLLTAGSAQAFDYPTGCDMFRVRPGTTGSSQVSVFFNPSSTAAVLPTTLGAVTTATSGHNIPVGIGDSVMYQRPRASTGFALVCATSASVSVEFWSRAGTT